MANISMMKDFSTDGGEVAVQDSISRLKFIASLRPGEKIDVGTLSVQGNSAYERACRTLFARGGSRAATFDFVKHTLDTAFELACTYLAYDDKFRQKIGKMLIESIASSMPGIDSLAKTYADDRMFVSRIETMVETMTVKTGELALPTLPPPHVYCAYSSS